MARQAVKSSNYAQHNFFNGQFVDEAVSLARSCKRFDLVSLADEGTENFVFFVISFEPLRIPNAPSALGLVPNKFQGFPLHFSRLQSSGNNNFQSRIKFKCPFTDFYVNAWGISNVDGSVADISVNLIASDGDIEEYETQPAIFIQVG